MNGIEITCKNTRNDFKFYTNCCTEICNYNFIRESLFFEKKRRPVQRCSELSCNLFFISVVYILGIKLCISYISRKSLLGASSGTFQFLAT